MQTNILPAGLIFSTKPERLCSAKDRPWRLGRPPRDGRNWRARNPGLGDFDPLLITVGEPRTDLGCGLLESVSDAVKCFDHVERLVD